MYVEIETGALYITAQKSPLFGLVKGYSETVYRKGVLGADIEITVVSPDGVSTYGQPLYHGMGVCLQNRAVHKGTGVALVGIADNIFRRASGLAAEFPLDPGGKTGPTTPTQP